MPKFVWTDLHTSLRDVLAQNFRSQEDSDALLIEARLDLADFEAISKPSSRWTRIIREVAIRNQLPALIDTALKHYPEDEDLLAVKQGYLAGRSGQGVDANVSRQALKPLCEIFVNLLGHDRDSPRILAIQAGLDVAFIPYSSINAEYILNILAYAHQHDAVAILVEQMIERYRERGPELARALDRYTQVIADSV